MKLVMKKNFVKKLFLFVIVGILLIQSLYMIVWTRQHKENEYDIVTEVLLKSSGWKVSSEIEKFDMPLDGFDGAWIAAKDSVFNIPGFEDNISKEYSYVAGDWKPKNKTNTNSVMLYKAEVIDAYGVLPENVHMSCSVAYYQGQVCMARVVPLWEELLENDIVQDEAHPFSFPITESRENIIQSLEYYGCYNKN